MRFLQPLRARFPKLYPVAAAVLALGAVSGIAAYERTARAAGDCCYAGSPCCYPGSPCCAGHHHAAK
ncbi:MAG TPA: hypothetical protein VIF62_28910 [Labilithrix sp.]|jgi:hypothetical protein